jgi:hypothetical protein
MHECAKAKLQAQRPAGTTMPHHEGKGAAAEGHPKLAKHGHEFWGFSSKFFLPEPRRFHLGMLHIMVVTCNRYEFITVSIPKRLRDGRFIFKPLYGGFRSETATWIQKYMTVTPERTPASVGKCPLHI